MIIEPAWGGVFILAASNLCGGIILWRRNGTSNAKWDGKMEERIKGQHEIFTNEVKSVKEACTLCRTHVTEDFKVIREDVRGIKVAVAKAAEKLPQRGTE